MPIGTWFWIFYVLAILFGSWSSYQPNQPLWYRSAGAYFILWVLVGILGWHAFGPVIR
jgi:hypothetical protein